MPEQFTVHLPRYPIPVVLLGRMAVDRQYERQDFGTSLVIDALLRVYEQDVIAVFAMIVDPKENARDFYIKFGFIPLVENPDRLFLHLQTFVDTLAAS